MTHVRLPQVGTGRRWLGAVLACSALLANSPRTVDVPLVSEDAKLLEKRGDVHHYFGTSVAVSGEVVAIGSSGSAYVFEKPPLDWTSSLGHSAELRAKDPGFRFDTVAMSGDTVVAGTGADSVYVFEMPPGGWSGTVTEGAKLVASDGEGDDGFGVSVAIAGSVVVIGAHEDDDGARGTGSAYVFERPPGGWSGTVTEAAKLVASNARTYDRFGISVAVSGPLMVVGALNCDTSYVFERPPGGWSGVLSEAAQLRPSDGGANIWGCNVAVAGSTVVIGSHPEAPGPVLAYVFEEPSGGWSGVLKEDAMLVGDRSPGFLFPFEFTVAVSDSIVVVGARDDRPYPFNTTGSVFVFEKPAGGWQGQLDPDAKLLASDGANRDLFGGSVAISDRTVVVGAPWDDDYGSASGSAYLFELAREAPVLCQTTGHYYEFVSEPGITWSSASTAAEERTSMGQHGHLATFTSRGETACLVHQILPAPEAGGTRGAWIGGFQDPDAAEPAEGWMWVTGERLAYSNWCPSEPNSAAEDFMEVWVDRVPGRGYPGCWNDARNDTADIAGYVVEYPVCDCRSPTALRGTAGADQLEGTPGPDILCGFGGDDVLDGLGGDDCLFGGAGDDLLLGGVGDDLLIGGGGSDALLGERGKDRLAGGVGPDSLFGGGDADELRGGEGNDELWGGSGPDTVLGGEGMDVLRGQSGNDELAGGNGADVIFGGFGNDDLAGGPKDDELRGGAGKDKCRGGGGTDSVKGCEE